MYYKTNELCHYGILGQKWGVRRYQNEDGTLTDAGKKRYDRDVRENNARKKDNRIVIEGPDTHRWVNEDLTRTKKVVDETAGLVKGVSKLHKNTEKKKDLSSMSDAELRSLINRAQLEQQYKQYYGDIDQSAVTNGQKRVDDILRYGGQVLTASSSILSLVLGIKQLKG